jgi:hypothetical protein
MRVSGEAAFKDDGWRTRAGASQVDLASVVEADQQARTIFLGYGRLSSSPIVGRAGAEECGAEPGNDDDDA